LGVFLKICDFVFVLRPLILIPAWSFYLIGAAQARGEPYSVYAGLPSPTVLLSLTSILISAYLLNQIFDRESDEKNDKCFYLTRGIFQGRTLVVFATVFFLIASFAFHRVDGAQRFALLLALILALLYSLPPVRLCARPFLDTIANAVGYGGVAYVLGYGSYGSSLLQAIIASIPYVLLVASTFLHTTILDVIGDKAAGKISTAVYIGERRSASAAAVLHTLGVVSAAVTGNAPALVITGVALPITIYVFVKHSRQASAMQIQATTLIVTVAAVAFWPVYAVIVAPLIILSRVYYARRFGITYPGPQKNA
jgi:4-hydroxybenzoate polyprenyltransferase